MYDYIPSLSGDHSVVTVVCDSHEVEFDERRLAIGSSGLTPAEIKAFQAHYAADYHRQNRSATIGRSRSTGSQQNELRRSRVIARVQGHIMSSGLSSHALKMLDKRRHQESDRATVRTYDLPATAARRASLARLFDRDDRTSSRVRPTNDPGRASFVCVEIVTREHKTRSPCCDGTNRARARPALKLVQRWQFCEATYRLGSIASARRRHRPALLRAAAQADSADFANSLL
jgi:hypothetical protein